MAIGALIIGDEILSGKRQDKHFEFLKSLLAKRGLELDWVHLTGDDPQQLERSMRFAMQSEDIFFSFGGIGATPDDRTRQTVAKVVGVAIEPHPEAIRLIEQTYAERAYPNRVLMGHLPVGATLIPNAVNNVAGFSFASGHFMPGFPEMAWPMCEWVMSHHYADLRDTRPACEQIIYVIGGRESDLLFIMQKIDSDFPSLKLSSLPCLGEPPHIEMSLRGAAEQVEKAMTLLKQAITETGFTWQDQLTQ
ncbi:Molybdopterin binding domain protein [Methylophaga frappieri]|uniref:Molybdopterin binding domain protein n=1 Tax=Methylophaga frappieri (strain ATCC BAA-2434 / DSM 25690 / JAM7) TaxID=754477 RepID=I1YE52_METFJ|nr:competence/damage-inducible protein A [Methylophaga frappieri]AFJ01195.1 Molybdopterin binding domain protein [Methylophaga frappieri]